MCMEVEKEKKNAQWKENGEKQYLDVSIWVSRSVEGGRIADSIVKQIFEINFTRKHQRNPIE